jgi:hypothetical protein
LLINSVWTWIIIYNKYQSENYYSSKDKSKNLRPTKKWNKITKTSAYR